MIIYNNIIPFTGYKICNLCGILFVREDSNITYNDIRHENIHTRQMIELLFVGFYLIYIIEWLIKGIFVYPTWHQAYRNISFEREAYANEKDITYLGKRRLFSMWR